VGVGCIFDDSYLLLNLVGFDGGRQVHGLVAARAGTQRSNSQST
jgi:hypothetical protein